MEVREEIVEIVTHLPDEALKEILEYVRKIEKTTLEKLQLTSNLTAILDEDNVLLEKLAK